MMDYTIIDAHAHLWLRQDTVVEGFPIRTLENGRSLFMGEERQILPPFMIDGVNSAEVFLSNMDYVQVSQPLSHKNLLTAFRTSISKKWQPTILTVSLCVECVNFAILVIWNKRKKMITRGFKAIKIPAHRLLSKEERVNLNCVEMMQMFHYMEEHDILLSIDLAEGTTQLAEMEEVIQECPCLKIAIEHFGMVTFSDWKEQIKLACHPNVMIESGEITWLFNAEFYPFKGAVRAVREAAELVGMDKLMWGSDYPRTITAITYKMSYDFITKSVELSEKEKRLFLGENARKFYGFTLYKKMSE